MIENAWLEIMDKQNDDFFIFLIAGICKLF